MTKFQELKAKLNGLRRDGREKGIKLMELAMLPADDRTDEQKAELATLQTFRLDNAREVLIVEDAIAALPAHERRETYAAPSSEQTEFAGMIAAASLGRIIMGVAAGRAVEGAERELQQHFNIAANEVPIQMLTPRPRRAGRGADGVERYAAGATVLPARDADTQYEGNQETWSLPPFGIGDMDHMGAFRPVIENGGTGIVPVIENRPDVHGPHSDATDAPETNLGADAAVVPPQRIQASAILRRTDMAAAPGLDDAVGETLSSGLREGMDKLGVDTLLAADAVAATAAVATVESYATYRQKLVHDRIDGRYAATAADIRVLVGTRTLRDLGSEYRSENSDSSALDVIERETGGVRVSPHIPAPHTANKLQYALVRRGAGIALYMPTWQGVALVTDEVSRIGTGQVEITAIAMTGAKVVRSDAFNRVEVRFTA